MERLTRYFYENCAGVDCEKCGRRKTGKCNTSADCAQTIADRLAAIEDILGDEYDPDRLCELVEADRDGRCVVLPKDGMVYYIEEAGDEKWVANKPIQQITVKCGWGLASLEFSLLDTGKYFSREAAEAELERGQKNGM